VIRDGPLLCQKSGKHSTIRQADSGFGGQMLRKTQGEPLKPDHAFAFCRASFLMTFAMGGIPHAGSWQESLSQSRTCVNAQLCLYHLFHFTEETEDQKSHDIS